MRPRARASAGLAAIFWNVPKNAFAMTVADAETSSPSEMKPACTPPLSCAIMPETEPSATILVKSPLFCVSSWFRTAWSIAGIARSADTSPAFCIFRISWRVLPSRRPSAIMSRIMPRMLGSVEATAERLNAELVSLID